MPYGTDGQFGVALQNSYGTSNTASLYWMPILNENLAVKRDVLVSQNMRGKFDASNVYQGQQTNDGSIEMEIDAKSIGVFLTSMMAGTATTSGSLKNYYLSPRASDYDTTYSPCRPLTIHKYMSDGGSAFIFYDMVPVGLEFKVANGELVKAKVDLIGGKFKREAASTASYPTNTLFTWDACSLALAGSGVADFTDITIKIAENIANKFALNGARTPQSAKRQGFRDITVEGSAIFNDQTQLNRFLSNSEMSFSMYMANSSQVQSGYFESIKIDATKMQYTTYEPTLGGPGLVEVPFSARCNFDSAAGSGTSGGSTVTITLTNTQGGYV